MISKRCIIASLAVIAASFVLDFILHGVLLADIYKETADLWRPEAEMKKLTWLMWVGYLVFAPLFVKIYSKGYEEGKSGLGQGLKYGLLLGLLFTVPTNLVWYAVLPISATLTAYWLVGGLIQIIILGAIVGLIWKKA